MRSTASKLASGILATLALAGPLRAGQPSAADVGDAETFGRNVQYMGAGSGFVTLSPDCSAEPSPLPGPPINQCLVWSGGIFLLDSHLMRAQLMRMVRGVTERDNA